MDEFEDVPISNERFRLQENPEWFPEYFEPIPKEIEDDESQDKSTS